MFIQLRGHQSSSSSSWGRLPLASRDIERESRPWRQCKTTTRTGQSNRCGYTRSISTFPGATPFSLPSLGVCVLLGPWLATTQRNASASITASRRLVKISKIDHTPKEEEHAPVLLFTDVYVCVLHEETFSFSDTSVTTSTCSCLGTI